MLQTYLFKILIGKNLLRFLFLLEHVFKDLQPNSFILFSKLLIRKKIQNWKNKRQRAWKLTILGDLQVMTLFLIQTLEGILILLSSWDRSWNSRSLRARGLCICHLNNRKLKKGLLFYKVLDLTCKMILFDIRQLSIIRNPLV